MSKRSRTKGRSAEQEVVRILRGHWPEAGRNLDQVKAGGSGRDLEGTSPWCIQVKRRVRMTPAVIDAGLAEAIESLDGDRWRYAAVIHRSDRQPWTVTVPLRHLARALGDHSFTLPDEPVSLPLARWLAILRPACRRCLEPLASPAAIRAGIHLATCWRAELRDADIENHPGIVDSHGHQMYGVRIGRCSWCGADGVRVWQDGAIDRWWCDRCAAAASRPKPFGDPGIDHQAEADREEMNERRLYGNDYRPEGYAGEAERAMKGDEK